jgi:hypothetical protein
MPGEFIDIPILTGIMISNANSRFSRQHVPLVTCFYKALLPVSPRWLLYDRDHRAFKRVACH